MRLHRVEVTAFGPFPETIEIDFDALSAAGLFLLTGPTGAGKSSVLDAVCFALYGDVPGDRSSAKRLRCDQAADGVAPRVVLEATLGGRRYRIERSPAWTRPKRRGTGTTTEQAKVVLCERQGGEWVPLSTRLDETGHLVSHRVGLTLVQFCQVAMLPQGRFQAFLRARSEDRHALLQQVFRTGRFDQVEKWLREQRGALRRASGEHEEVVADRVSRVSEVAATAPPDGWQHEPASLVDWAGDLTAVARCDTALAARRRETSEQVLTEATEAADAGRSLATVQRRRADALGELARLSAEGDEVDRAVERLETARRAEAVLPVVDLAEDAVRRREAASAALADALARATTATGAALDAGALDEVRASTASRLADVARVRPVQERLRSAAAEASTLAQDIARLDLRLVELEGRAEALPEELECVRGLLAELELAAARVPELTIRLHALEGCRTAHLAAQDLTHELEVAETERASAVTALHDAKETWLDLRERRLDGMAAEIALGLVVGGCCPVCGSSDHPAPAAATAGAPDAAAERAARRRVDDLEATVEAHAQHVRDLAARLASARTRAGDEPHTLDGRLLEAQGELDRERTRAQDADAVRTQVAALEREQSELASDVVQLRSDRAARDAGLARLDALVHELEAQLSSVLGTASAPPGEHAEQCADDLDALEDRLRSLDAVCTRAAEARDELHRAELAAADAVATADRCAADVGFTDRAEVLAAVLGEAERTALAAQVAAHQRALHRASDTLAEPDVDAAGDLPAPDVAALEATLAEASEEAAAARRAHEIAAERAGRVAALGQDLAAAVRAWQPIAEELELVAGLASFVEGRSTDNRLQMRLSAYVLAHRLTQVVAAANLRLAAMSDQRYSLVHTGQRGAGETRGGLSLLVRDDWSGESRDPATLSGGETFVVSLALALGLADVIAGEAGGAELDTLFVDEGFGSLDADTLDDVMDTLDSLRDGGRVVGVVSHVPELQTRIPTQLRVHKARTGSRTTVRLG